MSGQSDAARRRSDASRKAMTARASQTRCKNCGRQNAMQFATEDAEWKWKVCRWCGYVRGLNKITKRVYEEIP